MDRVLVNMKVMATALVLALGIADSASAQATKAKAKAKAAPTKAAPPASKPAEVPAAKPSGRALQKTREGSLLKRDGPLPSAPDIRSDYERERDKQLLDHYRRLARLDWIEQLASKADDTRLLERVENVRRREIQRHRAAMTRLWEQARGRQVLGFK
jgi:hypothetical protein